MSREAVTVIDHNYNVGRKQVRYKKNRKFKYLMFYRLWLKRGSLGWERSATGGGRGGMPGRSWSPRTTAGCTTLLLRLLRYLWAFHNSQMILLHTFPTQFVRLRKVPDIALPTGDNIPRNQSKVAQPSKAELVLRQQTRLKLGSSNMWRNVARSWCCDLCGKRFSGRTYLQTLKSGVHGSDEVMLK